MSGRQRKIWGDAMTTYQFVLVDALEKVLPNQEPGKMDHSVLKGYAGERLSFQLAYSCQNDDRGHSGRNFRIEVISDLKTQIRLRKVGLVPCAYPCHGVVDENYLSREAGLYPDVLLPFSEEEEIQAVPGQWRSLWVDIDLGEGNRQPGKYPIQLILSDALGNRLQEYTLFAEVLEGNLPEQTLLHTEWFHADCLADYYRVPVFSEEHWRIIENFMKTAVRCGVNMLLTPIFTPPLDTAKGGERTTIQLVDILYHNGKYSFKFEKLHRWISLCRKHGIQYLEISHLFSQWGAVAAPKVMAQTEEGRECKLFSWDSPAVGGEYTEFLKIFLPELKVFLKEENILENSYFHISDEPNEDNMDSFGAAVESVRELLADCKVMDALSSFEIYRRGYVQRPVVAVNHIEPFVEAGVKNLWAYYCTGQAVDVPNRFIVMPSARNRILGVLCYIYQVEGFLHWGFNFYNSEKSIEHIDPYAVTDAGEAFPSGDPFIVYPGKDGTAYESMRSVVLEEALSDIRVLKMAEQSLGRDRVLKGIEETAGMKLSFMHYPKDKSFFTALREWVEKSLQEDAGC